MQLKAQFKPARFASLALCIAWACAPSTAQTPPDAAASQTLNFPTVLYGTAYYNEYMPGDQGARLQTDVAMIKAAGLNVVRMGESTWSL